MQASRNLHPSNMFRVAAPLQLGRMLGASASRLHGRVASCQWSTEAWRSFSKRPRRRSAEVLDERYFLRKSAVGQNFDDLPPTASSLIQSNEPGVDLHIPDIGVFARFRNWFRLRMIDRIAMPGVWTGLDNFKDGVRFAIDAIIPLLLDLKPKTVEQLSPMIMGRLYREVLEEYRSKIKHASKDISKVGDAQDPLTDNGSDSENLRLESVSVEPLAVHVEYLGFRAMVTRVGVFESIVRRQLRVLRGVAADSTVDEDGETDPFEAMHRDSARMSRTYRFQNDVDDQDDSDDRTPRTYTSMWLGIDVFVELNHVCRLVRVIDDVPVEPARKLRRLLRARLEANVRPYTDSGSLTRYSRLGDTNFRFGLLDEIMRPLDQGDVEHQDDTSTTGGSSRHSQQ